MSKSFSFSHDTHVRPVSSNITYGHFRALYSFNDSPEPKQKQLSLFAFSRSFMNATGSPPMVQVLPLRRLLAIFPLCARFLLRLDDDVNGPLSAAFLLLRIYDFLLAHLLLRRGSDWPQTLHRNRLCSTGWTVPLKFVLAAVFWAGLLCCSIKTKRSLL